LNNISNCEIIYCVIGLHFWDEIKRKKFVLVTSHLRNSFHEDKNKTNILKISTLLKHILLECLSTFTQSSDNTIDAKKARATIPAGDI
jgi:hypothetical protein